MAWMPFNMYENEIALQNIRCYMLKCGTVKLGGKCLHSLQTVTAKVKLIILPSFIKRPFNWPRRHEYIQHREIKPTGLQSESVHLLKAV